MSLKKETKFYQRMDFKITLWYVFTFLLTTLIIFSVMFVRLKQDLMKEIDRLLEDESRVFASEITENFSDINEAMRDYEEDIGVRESIPIYVRVLRRDGRIIASSKNSANIVYPVGQEKLKTISLGGRPFDTVKVSGTGTPFRILSFGLSIDAKTDYITQIGTRMSNMTETLGNFRHSVLTAIPILLVLGSIGGCFLARRSLAPIAHITATARRITASNLGERLRPRGSGDELDHLMATLNEMISRLEDSFKRISQFTADAAHELRTPISSMRGEAELLLSKPRSVDECQRVLANHIEKLDFMTRMINDLMLLSKFDSNEAGLEMAKIKLDGLVVNLWELFRVLAEQKGVEFALGEIEEAVVLGDRTRLQQLFTNLIDNAIKFTSSGGRIEMSLKKDGGFATVSVRDTGVGIPEEEFGHIFERFYRVDKSRARESGGTGLGLSISQSIAKAHHGKIELKSQPGEGSDFIVSMPLLCDR